MNARRRPRCPARRDVRELVRCGLVDRRVAEIALSLPPYYAAPLRRAAAACRRVFSNPCCVATASEVLAAAMGFIIDTPRLTTELRKAESANNLKVSRLLTREFTRCYLCLP